MDQLSDILRSATRAIEEQYFQLPIDGAAEPIYRERVYCYELYHQMRSLWPAPHDCRYTLNGEIDKDGHPLLRAMQADFAKPDFLIHTPGSMAGNHAIIEVKTERAGPQAIRGDLAKLQLFLGPVGYQRAIYLIYGRAANQTIARAVAIKEELGIAEPIEFWLHPFPGVEAAQQA